VTLILIDAPGKIDANSTIQIIFKTVERKEGVGKIEGCMKNVGKASQE
jgi:hypothetical protein